MRNPHLRPLRERLSDSAFARHLAKLKKPVVLDQFDDDNPFVEETRATITRHVDRGNRWFWITVAWILGTSALIGVITWLAR